MVVKAKKTDNEPTLNRETSTEESKKMNMDMFTEVAYGIARKKVLDKASGEERVRSFVVEIKYDPESGESLPATLHMMTDMGEAVHKFKLDTAKNIFKF